MNDSENTLTEDFSFWAVIFLFAFLMHLIDFWLSDVLWKVLPDSQSSSPDVIQPRQMPEKAPVSLSNAQREKRCRADRQCKKMAEALVYEARGEPLIGAVAVGHVILARARHPERFQNTIEKVVDAHKQFSYKLRQQSEKPSKKDWSRALVASYEVIHGEIENPVGYADHFHTLQVRPYWAKKMQYVATVGNHKFYRSQ